MKILKILGGFFAILLVAMLLSFNFFMADLRTNEIKSGAQSDDKIRLAQDILNEAISKQGLDNIDRFSSYEITGRDQWKGMTGKMGNPWKWNNDKMAMRFTVGDFDGQVEVLEGDHKGLIAGMQSWNYYEKKDNKYDISVETNSGITFTLAAFHYFFELGNRLVDAPVLRYAGKDQFNGQEMHKIFASWGNKATKDYDQYILWIGKDSKLIEATTFTTRDNPKPAPLFLYGSLKFDDYRIVDGIMIPFKQTAQIMNPKTDENDYIHQLTIETFEWDKMEADELRPLKGLNKIGDDKPMK